MRSIRKPDIVHQGVRTIQRICDRDHVARGRRRTQIPQILSVLRTYALLSEFFVLALHGRSLVEQRLHVRCISEFVDLFDSCELNGAVEEPVVLIEAVEAEDLPGPNPTLRSADPNGKDEKLGSAHSEVPHAPRIPSYNVVGTACKSEQRILDVVEERESGAARTAYPSC